MCGQFSLRGCTSTVICAARLKLYPRTRYVNVIGVHVCVCVLCICVDVFVHVFLFNNTIFVVCRYGCLCVYRCCKTHREQHKNTPKHDVRRQ